MPTPTITITDEITPDVVRELVSDGAAPHVSIFTSTERSWNEARKKNELLLRDRLDEAAARLTETGRPDAEIESLLAPGRDLAQDDAFWRSPTDGLALFLSNEETRAFRLPFQPNNSTRVDSRFHVRPLWNGLDPDGSYYVLALSLGGARLFRGTRYTFEEIELEDVPLTLDEELANEEHLRSLNLHTTSGPTGAGGGQAAVFHGGEDAGDAAYVKNAILRFFQNLENGVTAHLKQASTPPPLLLAGLDYLQGIYRKANHYGELVETGIEGPLTDWQTRSWDQEALHERAWEAIRPALEKPRRQAVERFGTLYAEDPSRVAIRVDELIPAAFDGRVETLFLPQGETVSGRFDPADRTVQISEDPRPGNTDLLELALARTMETGGRVFVLDPEAIPEAPVAAILRY